MGTHVEGMTVFSLGAFGRIGEALGHRLQAALARHAATGELAAMSEHELADMGINRTDVSRLFDPDLAHEYARRD